MSQVVTLREYQDQDANTIMTAFEDHSRIIYQLPTGAGKSVVSSQIALEFEDQGSKVLVLAHRKELISQMKKHLMKRGLKPGRIQASTVENLDSDVMVASIKSIIKPKYKEFISQKSYDLIIVDEAHHMASDGYTNFWNQLLEANPQAKLLGITATPYRKDKKNLGDIFDHLIVSCKDVQSLIAEKYLADYTVYFTPVEDLEGEVISYQNDYQMASLSTYMRKEQMINHLVQSYKKNGQEKQMIVFCCDKAHAKDVNEAYKKHGYSKIGHIDSDCSNKEREFILNQYEKENIQIITCIETLTEGIDLPETGCVQLARPTRSLTLYLQMIGRGLRPKKEGSKLIVLDSAGCTVKYGTPSRSREWSLDPEVDPSEKGSKGRVVVGVKSDGTFTKNTEEMTHCEVVEISEEDFFAQSEHAVENAKKHNKEISEASKAYLIKFAQQIINLLEEKEDWVTEADRWDENAFIIRHDKRNRRFDFKFAKVNQSKREHGQSYEEYEKLAIQILTFSIDSYNTSNPTVEFFDNLIFMYKMGGQVGHILNNTLKSQLKDLMVFRRSSEEKIVDVGSLQRRVDKFKEARMERQAEQYLVDGAVIELSRRLYLSDYSKGGDHVRITHIQVFGGIKFTSHVRFYVDSSCYYNTVGDCLYFEIEGNRYYKDTKYIKKEKLMELLKNGGVHFE